MRRSLLCLMPIFVGGPLYVVPQLQSSVADDRAVYIAVLNNTIRPLGPPYRGTGDSSASVVVDSTATACDESGGVWTLGCMGPPVMAQITGAAYREYRSSGMLDSLFSDSARKHIGSAFAANNSAPRAILELPRARLVRKSAPTTGTGPAYPFIVFSSPSYSSSGEAVVYATFFCGIRCGDGWIFALRREGAEWRVIAAQHVVSH